jgi:hypothetical protein
MRVLAAGLLGLAACGDIALPVDRRGDEPPPRAAPTQTGQAAGTTPRTPTAAPAAPVDCEALLSAERIAETCGATVDAQTTRDEGSGPLATCARKFRGPDGKSVSLRLATHATPGKVEALAWPADATRIDGLGDQARAYLQNRGEQFDWHTVEVRMGRRVLHVRSIGQAGAPPLCSLAQLETLARAAMTTIPPAR